MKKFKNVDLDTDAMKNYLVPIYPDGWKFVAVFAIGSLVFGSLMSSLLYIGILLTGWCVYFFRDPKRIIPQGEGLILSAADGMVDAIETVTPPEQLGIGVESCTRVSVRLSLMDVHVNRIPIGGTICAMKYHQGKFLNASLDKSHEENERQYFGIKTTSGVGIGVVQIAGLISRRIVCKLKENQTVRTGERFGIIRFGSRVDVYFPANVPAQVIVGQRVIAGETILADLTAKTAARPAEED